MAMTLCAECAAGQHYRDDVSTLVPQRRLPLGILRKMSRCRSCGIRGTGYFHVARRGGDC